MTNNVHVSIGSPKTFVAFVTHGTLLTHLMSCLAYHSPLLMFSGVCPCTTQQTNGLTNSVGKVYFACKMYVHTLHDIKPTFHSDTSETKSTNIVYSDELRCQVVS